MAFWLPSAQLSGKARGEWGENTLTLVPMCWRVFTDFFSLSPKKLLTTQAALQCSSFTMKICVEEKGGKRITTVCYALLITLAWKKVRYKFWFHVALFCETVEWFWTKSGLVLWQNILMHVPNVNKANGYNTTPLPSQPLFQPHPSHPSPFSMPISLLTSD